MKNILLVYGGGGTEHEVSVRSAEYILSKIDKNKFNPLLVEISKNQTWLLENKECELSLQGELKTQSELYKIDAAIPCVHGVPGETGELAALFSLANIPYFGCNQETSVSCFNKLLTKLVLENMGIETTPFLSLSSPSKYAKAKDFLFKHKSIFIKATNQGSSIGCYTCDKEEDVKELVEKAFELSPFVIIEKMVEGRELEISTFEHNGKIHITDPSEILCENQFYTYEEKYSSESKTTFDIVAKISEDQNKEIKRQAKIAYEALKIRHLSRMDFFIANSGEIYLNEVNTFPGHTEISMFPRMMENTGIKYEDFLNSHLDNLIK